MIVVDRARHSRPILIGRQGKEVTDAAARCSPVRRVAGSRIVPDVFIEGRPADIADSRAADGKDPRAAARKLDVRFVIGSKPISPFCGIAADFRAGAGVAGGDADRHSLYGRILKCRRDSADQGRAYPFIRQRVGIIAIANVEAG